MNKLVLIVAVSLDGYIGQEGDIPWKCPQDMRNFADTTRGNCVIMGRHTYESIGKPLPDRHNIVVSNTNSFEPECDKAKSVEQAIAMAKEIGFESIFIIGGERLYCEALPYATEALVSVISTYAPKGDTSFPALSEEDWVIRGSITLPRRDSDIGPDAQLLTYVRIGRRIGEPVIERYVPGMDVYPYNFRGVKTNGD